MSQYVCQECRETVDSNAHRCPHCGYDAGESLRRKAGRQRKLGGLLCLLLVGIPIGLPLGLLGMWNQRKAKKQTVGTPA